VACRPGFSHTEGFHLERGEFLGKGVKGGLGFPWEGEGKTGGKREGTGFQETGEGRLTTG